uniref:Repressor of RNA polymerase III transcription MAF1 n=1 Tax=Kwoniella dejecticola CBS 10117 TaxID=1296121 RepID=A0A1A6AD33_9TREE|nr:uncharacterized protein I303_02193 [Kwoniella dejecticola CBS 10117]OBR87977.1 hypothetical protein I303_02193 [Kwoniella dejecticola CBS 10117]
MKYLDYPILNELSASLSSDGETDLRVHARFEAYSVKPVGKEKRAFKEREEAYMSEQEGMEEMSFSPEMREAGLASCFGRLDEKESRKVHFLLVSTLNAAFPDHDFTSLRPDHFTRERSAAQVLSQLNGTLLGSSGLGSTPIILSQLASYNPSPNNNAKNSPAQSPANSSPNLGPTVPNHDLYRILNEVLPMEDCEVYSWFPEPEYDPHIDTSLISSDEEEEDFVPEQNDDDIQMDMDDNDPAWGAGGMDMDVEPLSNDNAASSAIQNDWDAGRERKVAGLLWSANYFFYSKRQKRVLFLTCWCRNRPLHPVPHIESAFPVQISASFSSPTSPFEHFVPLSNGTSTRSHRYNHHTQHRKPKSSLRTISSSVKGDNTSSTIPIRGMEKPSYHQQPATPRSAHRLASSAPGGNNSFGAGTGTKSPMTKMMAGGFKPRQTPARVALNASVKPKDVIDVGALPELSSHSKERDRERERSGSTTPGPSTGSTSALTAGLRGNIQGIGGDKGKSLKV